jgi:putative nucleotidyltransferase with HDIG domain
MISILQAVNYLGIDVVKGLTLTTQVFESQNQAHVGGISLANLQKHSLLTAALAQRFASTPTLREEAFTAGIVHDIGKVVLALGFPDRVQELTRSPDNERPAHLVEKEQFGATHAEVGAYLLGTWGLPLTIVEAVAFHHEPGRAVGANPELLAVLHVAEALARLGCADPDATPPDVAFLDAVGLATCLPAWEALAREHFDTMAGRT